MPRTSRKKRPPSSLRKQKQIRATDAEWKAWGKHATRTGHTGVSAWLRYIANEELRRPPFKISSSASPNDAQPVAPTATTTTTEG